MAQKILTVEDNTAPTITLTLKRGGAPINLTTVGSVDLYIKRNNIITNAGGTACTVVTPLDGIIGYSLGVSDLANAGTYEAEVKITYGDATIETIYEKFNIKVRTKLQA